MYDMRFSLSDAPALGLLLQFIDVSDVDVEDGLFTVELDFDDAHFEGSDRWLSIRVDGVTLNPRTKINYTPYAIRASHASHANVAAVADIALDLEVPWVVVTDLDVVDATSTRGIPVRGTMSNTLLNNPGVMGETLSMSADAVGVLGTASSHSDSSPAVGVRGETNSTGTGGYGVHGIHRGQGTGVYGENSGFGSGVSGQSNGVGVTGTTPHGTGVRGISGTGTGMFANSAAGIGLLGVTNAGTAAIEGRHDRRGTQFFGASEDYGIEAYNLASTGDGVAIFGSGAEIGVQGQAQEAGSDNLVGVLGSAGSLDSLGSFMTGVRGYAVTSGLTDRTATGVFGSASATSSTDTAYGVYGTSFGDGTRFAGYFNGDVHVNGTLSKSSGSFKIDHPMDPENKYLSHSFVESPEMMNVYSGMVTLDQDGRGVVELPHYFDALNTDYRYQLTAIGAAMPSLHVAELIDGNVFVVGGGVANKQVSWEVTGVRIDASATYRPIVVEEDKAEKHRGLYLDPEAHGFGEERAIHRSGHHQQ